MSSVTRTRRFCANMILVAMCADYIMHNDDMQAIRSLARLAHIPRRDPVHLDHMHCRCRMYSRDRSRRT